MKKTLAAVLAFVFILSMLTATAFAADSWILSVNGMDTDARILWKDNDPYVPIRVVMEQFGYDVSWNGQKRQAEVSGKEFQLILQIDEKSALLDQKKVPISDIILKKGTTYIPVSFLEDTFHVVQEEEEKTKRLYLYKEDTMDAFITAEYPIVIVPSTLSCWSSVDFDEVKAHVRKDSENAFTDIALTLVRPMLLSMLNSIEAMERSIDSHYITETNGDIFYIEPFWDTYIPLCKYLESYGLEKDRDYFIFGYDTLNVTIEDNAQNLEQFIASVLAQTGETQIQLIAHSQGGLIARYYIQNLDGYKTCAKFLGVGVPNQGVSYTYPLYAKGSFNPLDGREMMIAILAYFAYGDFSDESKMQLVQEHSKSIVQMLPTYVDTGDLENSFLKALNRWDGLKKLDRMGKDNILFLAGSGCSTISDFDAKGEMLYSYAGDSTVLTSSAILDGYAYGLLSEAKHPDLLRADSGAYRYFDLTIR